METVISLQFSERTCLEGNEQLVLYASVVPVQIYRTLEIFLKVRVNIMLRRAVLFTCVFYIVLCRTLRESYLSNNSEIDKSFPVIALNLPGKSCMNSATRELERHRLAAIMPQSDLSFFGQDDEQRTSLQGRSYYNGFGTPATANYYPTFDPISVLASLAFLAFLLQTFASLFDRSRSLIPTIVSSRQSSPELKLTGITRRVLNALDEYDNLNENLVQNEQYHSGSV